jgi:hypothetical protein
MGDAHVDEEGTSNLATRLLFRATCGKSSYDAAQSDAYAAYLDGLRHREVATLAACGAWGTIPGNTRRDVHSSFFKKIGYATPTVVKTPLVNPARNLHLTLLFFCLGAPRNTPPYVCNDLCVHQLKQTR